MTDRCFACDRTLGANPYMAVTSDGQHVFVGAECHKRITRDGYQPPKGGPKLFPVGIGTAHVFDAQGKCSCGEYSR